MLTLLALLAIGGMAKAQGDQVNLSKACANGLQVDINGGANPGASVTSISWTWGDGETTTGFFPQSHTYLSGGAYTIQVTAYYNDGSTASASQAVSVADGTVSNCLALTITAGQGGSVFYQASVGSDTIPSGSFTTLELDFADDLVIIANPNSPNSFSSWAPTSAITGISGSPVDISSFSVEVVVTGNSGITGNFATPSQPSTPSVSSLAAIPNISSPIVALEGANFGTLPASYGLPNPFTGKTPYFRFRDLTLGWEAGYVGDSCEVTIYNWGQSELGLRVNAGGFLSQCPTPNIGDRVEIDVCNPETPSCLPRSPSTGAVQVFENVTGQLTFTLAIPNVPSSRGISGFSVGFTPTNLNAITNGIVTSLANQGITVSRDEVGYAMAENTIDLERAVSEADFLISLPTFLSDIVDAVQTLYESPEIFPLGLAQTVIEQKQPTPPVAIAEAVINVSAAEAALKIAQAKVGCESTWGTTLPEYLITREIASDYRLQITTTNLGKMPTNLSVPVSYYVVNQTTCTPETGVAYLEVANTYPAKFLVSLVP
jgi:hypothetical protein